MVAKGDGTRQQPNTFDLEKELSTIASKKILPKRVTDRIGEKIKENKIQINKGQLYILVEKLRTALDNYIKYDKKGVVSSTNIQDESNMNELVEQIKKLSDRIKNLEEKQIHGLEGSTTRLVTESDIEVDGYSPNVNLYEMKPLKCTPNDPESIVIIMKWLQYLVDKLGRNNLNDALDYYVNINWITDDVRLDLIDYSKGITEKNSKDATKKDKDMNTKDHIQSLLFIQKLKGKQLDERFIWKIDRELEKMSKNVEDYIQNKK